MFVNMYGACLASMRAFVSSVAFLTHPIPTGPCKHLLRMLNNNYIHMYIVIPLLHTYQ